MTLWVQGWCIVENTRLTSMWPGFDTRLGVICGLSLLVLSCAPRSFSTGTPVFPSPQKPTFDLSSFELICVNCLFQLTVSPISAPALERLDT